MQLESEKEFLIDYHTKKYLDFEGLLDYASVCSAPPYSTQKVCWLDGSGKLTLVASEDRVSVLFSCPCHPVLLTLVTLTS